MATNQILMRTYSLMTSSLFNLLQPCYIIIFQIITNGITMEAGAEVVYYRRFFGYFAQNRCFYDTISLRLVFFQTLKSLLQLLQNIKNRSLVINLQEVEFVTNFRRSVTLLQFVTICYKICYTLLHYAFLTLIRLSVFVTNVTGFELLLKNQKSNF